MPRFSIYLVGCACKYIWLHDINICLEVMIIGGVAKRHMLFDLVSEGSRERKLEGGIERGDNP